MTQQAIHNLQNEHPAPAAHQAGVSIFSSVPIDLFCSRSFVLFNGSVTIESHADSSFHPGLIRRARIPCAKRALGGLRKGQANAAESGNAIQMGEMHLS